MKRALYGLLVLLAVAAIGCNENLSVVAPGAEVQKLASGFDFTEGPVADARGNVFFTDIPNIRIHTWSPDGSVSTFVDQTGEANGLYFDAKGNLLACQGGARKLVSIDASGEVTTLADKYDGKKLNTNKLLPQIPQSLTEEYVKQQGFDKVMVEYGVVLEKHLGQVAINHNVKTRKKNPTISDYNDLLKNGGVLDVPSWRQIQRLGDIRSNLADHPFLGCGQSEG